MDGHRLGIKNPEKFLLRINFVNIGLVTGISIELKESNERHLDSC